jgi:hypothetical protein
MRNDKLEIKSTRAKLYESYKEQDQVKISTALQNLDDNWDIKKA